MKIKIIYAMLLLLCCTLGASSNRNITECDALKHDTGSVILPMGKENTEAGSEETGIPAVTSYLPGYSIIFMN